MPFGLIRIVSFWLAVDDQGRLVSSLGLRSSSRSAVLSTIIWNVSILLLGDGNRGKPALGRVIPASEPGVPGFDESGDTVPIARGEGAPTMQNAWRNLDGPSAGK
jgi:hypothetical protein